MHVVECRQHPDSQKTRFGDADFADALEVTRNRLRGDVLEHHVRAGRGGAPSEKPHEVGVLES